MILVTFQNTRQDFLSFSWHYFWKYQLAWTLLTIAIVVSIFMVYYYWTITDGAASIGEIVLIAGAYFVGLFAVTMGLTWVRSRFLKLGDSFLTEQTLKFSHDQIWSENKFATTELKWDFFKSITETERHYFLFPSARGAVIIPKKDLVSEQVEELRTLFQTKKLLNTN